MRKLKLQMQATVDGYVAGPNGEMDWMQWNWDDGIKSYVQELTAPVDCILLGRKLAEGFIPHWTASAENPDTADAFSHKMVDTRKIVFSKTLQQAQGINTELAEKGDLKQVVTRLKEQPGNDIIVYGGVDFVSELMKEGLIDEYNLFINPASLGWGRSIFKDFGNRIDFKLAEAKSFDCGVAVLKYRFHQ